MSIVGSNALAGASGQSTGGGGGGGGGSSLQITKSLRLNSADTAHLSRTMGTFTDINVGTISVWLKRSALGAGVIAAGWDGGVSYSGSIQFNSSDNTLQVSMGGSAAYTFKTNATLRDVSSWYHVVAAWNRSASGADKVKVWINGVAQTSSDTGYQSWTSGNCQIWAANAGNRIGRGDADRYDNLLSGYLAEYHYVDGTALAASDFGLLDSNNVWQPKQVSGVTYGTNGFYLDFSDATSAATLAEDSSGNNNDWTANNITAAAFGWASTTWSSDISIDSGNFYLNNNDGDNGFDGNSSTYIDCRLGSGSNNTTNIIWEPTGGIANVTKIRVHSEYADDYRINNGSWTSFSSGGSYTQIYSGSAITLTKLEIRRTGNSGSDYGHRVTAYELNDIEVRDNLAQSADASGVDSLIDTPTNYTADSGNNGGNYCTLNPLDNESHTLSNGNLDITNFGSSRQTHATILPSSGKWYAEFYFSAAPGDVQIGVANINGTSYGGSDTNSWGVISINGNLIHNNSQSSYGSSFTTGDTIMVALDMDNGKWYAGKNGTWFNSGNPANGTNPAHTGLSGNIGFMVGSNSANGFVSCNFGARSFSYTPPTDFLSLCTTNLPDPTIADGSTAFDVKTWQGSGVNDARTISGYNFSPDFVWGKTRSAAYRHMLYDTVRGAGKDLRSDATQTEGTNDQYGYLSAFTSDGFTASPGSSDNDHWNHASKTYVAWAWDAGSSTASNTDGNITSQVRANTSAGFSIVSYTGTGTSGRTIGHGLNATPSLVIIKNRDGDTYWQVHGDGYERLQLNTTGAELTDGYTLARTSSTISPTGNAATFDYWNKSGDDFVAYCFAPVEGYSKFGTYTGNGQHNNDLGPFIFTGFRPAFIIFKRLDSTGAWEMYDSTRSPYNPYKLALVANTSGAEYDVGSYPADMLSNGFKIRHNGGNVNASGGSYLYLAWAEHPFKTSRAR